ncbi:hypothetical protein [Streptomyces sp. UNOC14_S4]|uniref:hypothetical protein n=1 Tax=Streptomyces sp. UNOC14_S4 TaxID=2872340 RepID=UPI001E516A97|nr:hypothetical protein [Streptomyces sp. UNOC14_S4]MCC3770872.1 hypothetical protein [Streptomyces sp. UNOC14_S4]
MDSLDHLRIEDTPDFEYVVQQALHFPEIRDAVRGAGTAKAPVSVEQLRSMALRARAEIAATAADEYRDYLKQRTAVAGQEPAPAADATASGPDAGGLLGALGVLVPTLAAVAAAAFLLLGYGLRLTGTQEHLADGLVTAGWTTAVIAVVAAVVSIGALLLTAVRQRPAQEEDGEPPEEPETEVSRSRRVWQQALLERGVLPFLHSALRETRR